VGLPLSQTVLSEDEKKRLPVIFERADIDPSDPPSPEIMIKLLRYHGEDIFEKRTRRLLNLKQGDDAILKNKLVELVLEELEDWDGTINDISKRAGEKESYIIPAGLRICIELDSISKRASAYVRLKTNRLYPEEGLRFESVSFPGSSLFCNEVFQGWSKPIKINDGSTKLNAADIDWTRGIQLEDKMHKWHARLKRDTVRLFISGKSEKLPGWIETQKLERGISFVIAAYAEASDKVRYWGEQSCESFCELNYSGLPKGWSIFKGINAHGSCKDVDVLSLSSALRLLLRGGIKIRGGNTYLKTAPPLIILENCSGMETVRMNGMPLAKLDKDSHIWMLPEDTPTKEILKIEVKVGEEELRRVLRLEEPMLANSFEEAPWRDIRGDICSSDSEMYKASGAIMKLPNSEKYISHSACLKPDSSKHMFFIGILSGQIVEWPQEDLPVDWEPVWVVEKMRRKEWKVNYCRESLDIIKNHGEEKNPDRSKVKKWKEIVWVKRKITRCPKIPLVRKKWMKFVEAARNV
ncbi:MAG: hypothetical protein U9R43_15410, partial [Thermodesulfobacteriota bacterium]|nr:hypothetical protein [Thermodesulfobacteriota bacterium]